MIRLDPRHVEAIRTNYREGLNLLPVYMHDGITHYIEYGRATGGFITSLLHGDHERAKVTADPVNKQSWENWMRFLLDHMPVQAFGTPEKVAAWQVHKGLTGIEDGEPDF